MHSRQIHTSRSTNATVLSSGAGFAPGSEHDAFWPDTNGGARYAAAVEPLLAALRQDDIPKLYFCLMNLTRGASEHDPDFRMAVQSISATTFSEILRCFDPVNISDRLDSAPDINISYGAALFTPLGELVNKWGVKILYVEIFNRLRLVQRARRMTRNHKSRSLLNDYAIMIRCAGAASDVEAAKSIWVEIKLDGFADWNHAHYADFLKAKYLTERLYVNNDLSRLRLRPIDMHRSSTNLDKKTALRLKWLSANMINRRRHRFGQNVNQQYFAEALSRVLRKRKPLMRIENKLNKRGLVPGDEKLACALLKANGRMSRIKASLTLLRSCWDISVVKDSQSGEYHISGGSDFPLASVRAPTSALLDAVATCFGNMGELNLALGLVDFISRRFDLPVPDSVWSDLLDYARIMQTDTAAREWRVARVDDKIARPETTYAIWEVCTQEPYKFKPGIRDYYNLTKSLIGSRRSIKRPLEALRHIKPLYDEAARDLEDAWLELTLTAQQGVSNHAIYQRYRVAQSRKSYIWYCIHYTTRQMLKYVKPGRIDDNNAVRHIPGLLEEFAQFMPTKVNYHIATGKVELRNDCSLLRPLEITQLNDETEPRDEDDLEHQMSDAPSLSSGSQHATLEETRNAKIEWEEDLARVTPRRHVLQVVDRPAYLFRPKYTSKENELTLDGLRRDGKVFTGYHDDPEKVPFAAHRVLRSISHGAGLQADLHKNPSATKMLEHVLWMRA